MVLISNMTMLFSNSSPKIPKSGIFGPKFKDFQFCIKFCKKINSRTLNSNIAIFFSNSRPKMPKEGIFGPKFRHFYFFTKFCNQTNQRVLTSNVAKVFLKIPVQQDKFEDFKYDKSIFKLQPKNTQNRHFCSQISGLLFCNKLCN